MWEKNGLANMQMGRKSYVARKDWATKSNIFRLENETTWNKSAMAEEKKKLKISKIKSTYVQATETPQEATSWDNLTMTISIWDIIENSIISTHAWLNDEASSSLSPPYYTLTANHVYLLLSIQAYSVYCAMSK